MNPTRIILHCSATEDGRTVSWGAIRRYHVEQRGWADIGYHFGVELVNEGYEILLGRFPDQTGAHCLGQNFDSLGICFVGEFDELSPPPAQWRRGIGLTAWLCRRYLIPADRVFGHRQFEPAKTCPGLAFDLDLFRNELVKELRK
jgi:hypothetical protein